MAKFNPMTGKFEFEPSDLLRQPTDGPAIEPQVSTNMTPPVGATAPTDPLANLEDKGYVPPTEEQKSSPGYKAAASWLANSDVSDEVETPVMPGAVVGVGPAKKIQAQLDELKALKAPSPQEGEVATSTEPIKQKQSLLDEYKTLLQRQQDQNRNLDLLAAANKIGQGIASGYGAKIDDGSELVNQLRKSADQPVEGYLGRQKALELEQKLKAADPLSDISKTKASIAKDLAAKADIDLSQLGDLNQLSADQLDEVMRVLNYNVTQKQQAEALKQQREIQNQNFKLSMANRLDQQAEKKAEKQEKIAEAKKKEATISDKQADKFAEFDKTKTLMQDLGTMVKDSYVGPLDQSIPDYFVGGDQAAFRSALGKLKDEYRKAITGAAASEKEIAMLETRLPSLSDSAENFNAKLKQSLIELEKIQNSYASTLEKKGKNVENYKLQSTTPSATDLDVKIDSFMKKNPQIKTKEEAVQILKANGKI